MAVASAPGFARSHRRRTRKNMPSAASDRCSRIVRLIVQTGVQKLASKSTGGYSVGFSGLAWNGEPAYSQFCHSGNACSCCSASHRIL